MVCKTTCFKRPWAQFIFSFMSNWPLAHSFIRIKLAFGPFIYPCRNGLWPIHSFVSKRPLAHSFMSKRPLSHLFMSKRPLAHPFILVKKAFGPFTLSIRSNWPLAYSFGIATLSTNRINELIKLT